MSGLQTFFTALWTIVLPILLVAGIAFGLGKRKIITEQRPLARASLYFFSPALAFVSLANSNVNASEFFSIIAFVVLMTGILGALSLGIARVLKFDRMLTSAFLLSILFVNAGNYGIPFTQFAFGADGVARAAIYFTVNSMLANTIAVYIASAGHSNMRASLRAVLKMPVAYAALLGLTFNLLHLTLPVPIMSALELAAAAALPVMLVNLGLEMARARLRDYDWRVFLATGIKLLVAPLIALALASAMGMQGLTRSVSVIEASMPTAVMASLIATEFRARSDFVTSVVFVSTLGSTVTLTLLLIFLGYVPTQSILALPGKPDYETGTIPLEILLVFFIVLALAAAFFLRRTGRVEQARAGVPINARVVYSDTGAWARLEKPLFSRRYRLAGKPDYIVQDETGATIPIEVKPTRTAAQPRHSDTMQLMAYGILIEEKFGTRPAYGLLKYRDEVFEIAFTEELRTEFFETLKEMRAARCAQNVSRNHADAVKCKYCGYREACEERLA